MPKITIEWLPGEREELNAKAKELGMMKCPTCEDYFWKPFHHVDYEEGELEIENDHKRPGELQPKAKCVKSQAVMCEECWAKASPDKRAEETRKLLDKYEPALRSIIKRQNREGYFYDCPKDTERFNKEKAAIEARKLKIVECARRGK
jgi:hypothetical protein